MDTVHYEVKVRSLFSSIIFTVLLCSSVSSSAHDLRLSAATGASFPIKNSNAIEIGGGYALSIDLPINAYGDHVWLGFQGNHMPLTQTNSDVTVQMLALGVNIALLRTEQPVMPYAVGGLGLDVDGWSTGYLLLGLGMDYAVMPSLKMYGEVVPTVRLEPSEPTLASVRIGVRYLF